MVEIYITCEEGTALVAIKFPDGSTCLIGCMKEVVCDLVQQAIEDSDKLKEKIRRDEL